MKKAIVIGSTGMVGKQLIKQLLVRNDCSEIISFVRQKSGVVHPKLSEIVIDFDKPESWNNLVKGDVLYSCLGTTLRQAKTKANQFKVDFEYQYKFAEIASQNGVSNYILISSAGANAKSNLFYMNMKGKLEEAVKKLPFKVISILQPGQLTGERNEKRIGENIGLVFMSILNNFGLFKRYKPIKDCQVAAAMINASEKTHSNTYTLDKVFELLKN
jgi:uncharacterized protein YbjT (DUF2867 family)